MPREYQGPSFFEKRKQLGLDKPEVEKKSPKTKPLPEDDPSAIPVLYEATEADRAIDAVLDRITILEAYEKWVRKTVDPATRNRREGIMVSCPIKGQHEDKVPSAWLNIDKGLWNCRPCGDIGGDMYDLAAWDKDYPVPGYKEDGHLFRKLREEMAADFGVHVHRGPGFSETPYYDEGSKAEKILADKRSVSPPVADRNQLHLADEGEKSSEQEPEPEAEIDNVTTLPVDHQKEIDVPERIDYPTLDWRSIVPEGTFLDEYMKASIQDDSPEEYHFWNGILALALTAGRKYQMYDRPLVTPNFNICMLGGTGAGKSKSRGYLTEILRDVHPDKNNGVFFEGVKPVSSPGSGEFLIREFDERTENPTNPKAPGDPIPVTGLVDFDELSGMISKMRAKGSTIKTAFMQLADANSEVRIGSLTHGHARAMNPFCCVTASVQPRVLKNLLKEEDATSGFLNRWIFVAGKKKPRDTLPKPAPDLSRAKDELRRVKAFVGNGRTIKLSSDAIDAHVDFMTDVVHPYMDSDENASIEVLSRLNLTVKKIYTVLALNEKLTEVTPEIVEKTRPIADYLVLCYALISSNVGLSLNFQIGEEIKETVLAFQQKHNKGMSPRDITRALHRKKYSAEQIRRTIDNLVTIEVLEVVKQKPGPGRPVTRYMVSEGA